ncbi:AAA family ATPase [candidate division KSB1 bacterium]|nr:AAA family ATPase [candidate division KSB1 bacterium]
MNSSPGICFSLLGRFCLYLGEREIPEAAFKSRKALSLLKLLAIKPKHQLHRDQAIDALWPELDPAAAAAQMYKSIHYIRKAFEATTVDLVPDELLVYKDETLKLTAPAEVHTDLDAFQHLAQEARRNKTLSSYQHAVASYTGDLLPADLYESWTEERRESARVQFLELLIALGQKHIDAGDFADAAEAFRRVLGIDPLDETAHQGLMRAFALQGNRSQALHQYKRCEEILAKELDTKPSAETVALLKTIREGKIQPAPQAAPKKAGTAKPASVLHKRSPMVGRQNELKMVATLLDHLTQGKGEVLLLQGMAGIGKTRLAQEIFYLAELRGYHPLMGSAYEQERELPYSPFVEALRLAINTSPQHAHLIPAELAAAIPELPSAPAPSAQTDAAAQSYLFAGLLRFLKVLADSTPVVMILEDLHFADNGTIKLFNYLARNAADFPLLLVGTCRSAEPEISTELTTLLAALNRGRLADTIFLQPLSEAEHQQLLQQSLEKGEVEAAFANEVFSFTEGNPLFAVEMVGQLKKAGEITLQDGVWRAGTITKPYLPPSLQVLLAQKWNGLSPKAQSLLQVVAVAGQQTNLNLLENILQLPSAEILDLLDETISVRLLKESGLTFSFVHPLFHEAVYQQMSQTRQRYLHGQVAKTLEVLYHNDAALPVEAIADHYLRSDNAKPAITYLIMAGDRASALYAHEIAINYYEQALKLNDGAHAAKLHESLGDQLGMLGKEQESAAHFEAAISGSEMADIRRLWRKAAYRYTLAGNLESAWRHLSEAIALAPATRDLEWVRLQYTLAHYHWQRNEFAEALEIARESLSVAEALGPDASGDAAKAYEMMALCCAPLGEWRHGLEYEAQRLSRVDLNRYLADVSDVHL